MQPVGSKLAISGAEIHKISQDPSRMAGAKCDLWYMEAEGQPGRETSP